MTSDSSGEDKGQSSSSDDEVPLMSGKRKSRLRKNTDEKESELVAKNNGKVSSCHNLYNYIL